jgi:hypothetical protein
MLSHSRIDSSLGILPDSRRTKNALTAMSKLQILQSTH